MKFNQSLATLSLLTASLLFQGGTARAADSYVVQSTKCKVFHFEANSWKPADAKMFPEGTQVKGTPHKGWPGRIMIRQGADRYSLSNHCVQIGGGAAGSSAVPLSSGDEQVAETPMPSTVSDTRGTAFFLYGDFWHEAMVLEATNGQATDLAGSVKAVQLGAEWRKVMPSGSEINFTASLIFGKSSLANTGTGTSAVTYNASGASLIGLALEGGYGFHLGRSWTVGPQLGLIFRSGSWPAPSTGGYTLSASKGIYIAGLAHAKFDIGHFFVASSLGFYGSASNYFFSIGPGWRWR